VFAFVAGSIGFFAVFDVILELAGYPGMSAVGVGFVLLVLWLYRSHGPARALEAIPQPATYPRF
jgi:hypothetical protein